MDDNYKDSKIFGQKIVLLKDDYFLYDNIKYASGTYLYCNENEGCVTPAEAEAWNKKGSTGKVDRIGSIRLQKASQRGAEAIAAEAEAERLAANKSTAATARNILGEEKYREAVTNCLYLKNCAPFDYFSGTPSLQDYLDALNAKQSLFTEKPDVNRIQYLAQIIADNAKRKGVTVGIVLGSGVAIGTGAGVAMAATGTAVGGTFTTLGLAKTAETGGAAATTYFATNPEQAGEFVEAVATKVDRLSKGARIIYDFMGPNATGKLNKAGDLVLTSEDKLFKFRVDFKNPGNDFPHMHLEQFIDGKWRDAIPGLHRIFPNN